jgi:hypothetical protein
MRAPIIVLALATAAAACSRGATADQTSGSNLRTSMDGDPVTNKQPPDPQPSGSGTDPDPLLTQVKKTVPDAVMIASVKLGLPALKGYWVGTSSGPPDRGVGVVSPDDKAFYKGADGFRRVLDTKTTDAGVLARASLLLLEHGGDPLSAASDLPSHTQAAGTSAGVAAPVVKGDVLSYWSYYSKTQKPDLARSDVNLKTLEVKRVRPGDGADPVAQATAMLAAPNPNTRRSGVERLAAACNDAAAAALLQALASSTFGDTRALAARYLPKCPGPDKKAVVTALVTALGKDADASAREWAAMSLGEFKDASARPALEKAAKDDASENVRAVAGMALKKL